MTATPDPRVRDDAARLERAFGLYAVAACAAGMALLLALMLRATGGALVCTLDDPYIHLAVAESILRGGYGVNFPEPSAPSSSVLWPWLMAALLPLGMGSATPLAVAAAASLGFAWVGSRVLFRRVVLHDGRVRRAAFWTLPPALLLGTNSWALPMTGMEHSLHVLAVALVASGLARLAEGREPGVGLGLGVVLCGLVRFEGLALSAAAIGVLLVLGRRRLAAASAAVLAVALAAHAALMARLGLPILPSSVLVKSEVAADVADQALRPALLEVLDNAYRALTGSEGVALALAACALAPIAWSRRRGWPLASAATAALAAHLLLGSFGGWGRYEIYAMALAILALAQGYGPRFWLGGGAPLCLAAVSAHYALFAAMTPSAARNIHEQQHQMHRFATDFAPGPVAVNDLGWVAWRNDSYVLDLWGLGSEEAREARRAEGGSEGSEGGGYLDRLTSRHGIRYAMIYADWFAGQIPDGWCRLAVLSTSKVTSASGLVSIYLVDRTAEAGIRDALARFAPTLPAGAQLAVHPCG